MHPLTQGQALTKDLEQEQTYSKVKMSFLHTVTQNSFNEMKEGVKTGGTIPVQGACSRSGGRRRAIQFPTTQSVVRSPGRSSPNLPRRRHSATLTLCEMRVSSTG